MMKRVELGPVAYRWLIRHRFISETVIISIVQSTPKSSREYLNENHFVINFRRKKDGGYVKITMWVKETTSTYFVYKLHSQRL